MPFPLAKSLSPAARKMASDKLFRDTFDNAAVGLAHVSPQGAWLRINNRLCESLGYSEDELKTLTFQDITHPDDLASDLASVQKVLAGEIQRYSMEKRYFHKSGTLVWAQLTVSLIRTQNGAPDYFISVVEDISQRKALERQLHERELQNSIMAQNVPCGLARLDTELRFQFANHAFEEAFNRPASEIVGRYASELFLPAVVPSVLHHASIALRGETVRYQSTYPLPNGEVLYILVTMAPQKSPDDEINGLLIVVNDISELQRTQAALHDSVIQLRHLAHHDPLTGLPNRALFHDRLSQALAAATRSQNQLALVYLDLDEFKPVNDRLGHRAGDLVLQEAARRMRAGVRESDSVARIGGDEFVLLLPLIGSVDDAMTVALKVQALIAEPMLVNGHTVHVFSSAGIAVFPDHAADADELMSRADTAMYLAKRAGHNQVLVYGPHVEGDIERIKPPT
jgi:diguanylate cyclase (GGDEF)-like protein/PAS domain S-box-containing protein